MTTFLTFVAVIAFIIIGMMWPEGLWSNALTFINTIFSGLVAWNYFEPLADLLEEQLPSFTYIVDYLSFWLIFAVFFNVSRAATDQISKTKARFRKPVEIAGGAAFAFLTAGLMATLVCVSISFAPLGAFPFRGSFGLVIENSTERGKAQLKAGLENVPINIWLTSMARLSKKEPNKTWGTFATRNTNEFSPDKAFLKVYLQRRMELEEYNNTTGSIRYDKSKQRRQ